MKTKTKNSSKNSSKNSPPKKFTNVQQARLAEWNRVFQEVGVLLAKEFMLLPAEARHFIEDMMRHALNGIESFNKLHP